MLASSRRCYFDKRKENTMAFDIMNLFEETENVITELDEGNELAAVDFANRISSMSPSAFGTYRCNSAFLPL